MKISSSSAAVIVADCVCPIETLYSGGTLRSNAVECGIAILAGRLAGHALTRGSVENRQGNGNVWWEWCLVIEFRLRK